MRFLKISYTGMTTEGAVIDTTEESVAKEKGVYDKERSYRPLIVVSGENMILKGIDSMLEKMGQGKEQELRLAPTEAFGERDQTLVRLVPIREFRKQNVNPTPGAVLEIEGRPARIQAVSGGRVRVDFNHPLAGKEVIYKIKIVKEAKDKDEKIKYLLERNFGEELGYTSAQEAIRVEIPEKLRTNRYLLGMKASFFSNATKLLGVNEITFVESWKKK